ncbi:MAG: hypothetical protein COV72_05440 [Candidatus Omnitrophica bacterium CG11_big_fil_rev_8_21_14_0_20_42_13]|uniref:DUF3417 domain-containing protein n=1 Tax=Candidatus Ghiorseimicrobium undicola TaxID=1974746 RepID=A0A2H0LZ97_9BACT|nr:MAG: hypothetical protein COV72_05440 [Candidatus Omnitrophica bacterium CG11_big_fil_rev_8_21_14_0_20_42_13]
MLNYKDKNFIKLAALLLIQVFLVTSAACPESISNNNTSSVYIKDNTLRVPIDSTNGYKRMQDALSAGVQESFLKENKGWQSRPEYAKYLLDVRNKILELRGAAIDVKVYYYAVGGGFSSPVSGVEDIDIVSPLIATEFTQLIGADVTKGDYEIFKRRIKKDLSSLQVIDPEKISFGRGVENIDGIGYPVFTANFSYLGKIRKVKIYYQLDAAQIYPDELKSGYNILYSRGNPGLIGKMSKAVKSGLINSLFKNNSFIVMENLPNSDLSFDGFEKVSLGDVSWAGARKLDFYTNISKSVIKKRTMPRRVFISKTGKAAIAAIFTLAAGKLTYESGESSDAEKQEVVNLGKPMHGERYASKEQFEKEKKDFTAARASKKNILSSEDTARVEGFLNPERVKAMQFAADEWQLEPAFIAGFLYEENVHTNSLNTIKESIKEFLSRIAGFYDMKNTVGLGNVSASFMQNKEFLDFLYDNSDFIMKQLLDTEADKAAFKEFIDGTDDTLGYEFIKDIQEDEGGWKGWLKTIYPTLNNLANNAEPINILLAAYAMRVKAEEIAWRNKDETDIPDTSIMNENSSSWVVGQYKEIPDALRARYSEAFNSSYYPPYAYQYFLAADYMGVRSLTERAVAKVKAYIMFSNSGVFTASGAAHFSLRSKDNSLTSKAGLNTTERFKIGRKEYDVNDAGIMNKIEVNTDKLGTIKPESGLSVTFTIRGPAARVGLADYLRNNTPILQKAMSRSESLHKGLLSRDITIILADKYDYLAGDHKANNLIILNASDLESMLNRGENPVFVSELVASLMSEELAHERGADGKAETEEILAQKGSRGTRELIAEDIAGYIKFIEIYSDDSQENSGYLAYLKTEAVYADLAEVGQNLWFEWDYKARDLYKMMDPALWNSYEVDQNPALFLKYFGIKRLKDISGSKKFRDAYAGLMTSYRTYMDPDKKTWVSENYPELKNKLAVYSSFEFGISKFTQNLQSGGLGALSGDHVKEMSDMGFNFIGVGLGYKYGYFTQRINSNGDQEDVFNDTDFSRMPKREVIDKQNGKPLLLEITMYDTVVYVKVWEVMVGRGRLYLLDTDIAENGKDDRINWKRRVTKYLYSKREGEKDQIKFHQAYILGIGEAFLLDKLGIKADFYHLNESHSGFAIIGLIKDLMKKTGLSFEQAAVTMYYKSLFTIHTPIPAGNWAFSKAEHAYAFNNNLLSEEEHEKIAALGDKDGLLNMAQLLLNLCGFKNGVSDEHGSVSREQWGGYVIGEILNGVSIPYWQSSELQELIESKIIDVKAANQVLGDEQILNLAIDRITDSELWDAHMPAKKRLIEFARKNVKNQRVRNNERPEKIKEADILFDENAFTIVVARRFAEYKRSDWVLSGDFTGIKRIFTEAINAKKPVQLIFAGKAHPEDVRGQIIIRRIHDYIKQLEENGIKNQVVFLENYNLDMAHYLEQGCDLWLSYPEVNYIPQEASATSGEKVAVNGIINGGIPTGFMRKDLVHNRNAILFNNIGEFHNELDLKNPESAINKYYGKNIKPSKRPSGEWLSMMRESLRTGMLRFGTDRMIEEYARKYYTKEAMFSGRMEENNYKLAKKVAAALEDPEALLKKIDISNVSPAALSERAFKTDGTYDPVNVEADVKFKYNIPPEAAEVSIIFKQNNRPDYIQAFRMEPVEDKGGGTWRYRGVIDTILRWDFLKDVFKSETRDFRLDKAMDCTYQIRVRPIISFSGTSSWAEKRSQGESYIRILPNIDNTAIKQISYPRMSATQQSL